MKNKKIESQKQKCFVGVDVSKDILDVCLLPMNLSRQFANSPEGIDRCTKFLNDFDVEIVLCEATGGDLPSRLSELPLVWASSLPLVADIFERKQAGLFVQRRRPTGAGPSEGAADRPSRLATRTKRNGSFTPC